MSGDRASQELYGEDHTENTLDEAPDPRRPDDQGNHSPSPERDADRGESHRRREAIIRREADPYSQSGGEVKFDEVRVRGEVVDRGEDSRSHNTTSRTMSFSPRGYVAVYELVFSTTAAYPLLSMFEIRIRSRGLFRALTCSSVSTVPPRK